MTMENRKIGLHKRRTAECLPVRYVLSLSLSLKKRSQIFFCTLRWRTHRLRKIRKLAERDPAHRKLLVRERSMINNKKIGESKGYGCSLLNSQGAQQEVVTVNWARSDEIDFKIYVSNVPHDPSAVSMLLSVFAQYIYGNIEEGPLGFDKVSGKTVILTAK
ncbi:hypothetical protein L7F22_036063 [Adiantum nelumboides]|nr:hypothetical protein [Adiantum nelumboides]